MPKVQGRHIENRLTPVSARRKGPGRHHDGRGLYLLVSPTGSRSWVLRVMARNTRHDIGLGSTNDVSLADAREKARHLRKIARAGGDPLSERRRSGMTFGAFADQFVLEKRPEWKNEKHAAQWKTSVEEQAAALRPLPIEDVDTQAILEVLKPLWTKTPETASRLRGRIEMVLDAARAANLRAGENPARWRGHLKHLLPKRRERGHHRALPYERVPEFMTALRAQTDVAARLLELTILTAARSVETRGALPAEFDLDKAAWTVPAGRMKAKREHRVPLCARAVELVAAGEKEGFVFPGRKINKPMSDMAMTKVVQRMGFGEVATVHGFRSTFRTWAQDCTSFPADLCEAALAHKIPDKTQAAYARGTLFDRRRKLMDAWADFCASSEKVVKLKTVG